MFVPVVIDVLVWNIFIVDDSSIVVPVGGVVKRNISSCFVSVFNGAAV